VSVRSAAPADADAIHDLIAAHVADGALLPRPAADVRRHIRDFVVAVRGADVVACGALHLYGRDLAEIRSVAVRREFRRRGIGRAIVAMLLHRAHERGVGGVCLFTREPAFFASFGFVVVERERVPEKFYRDCRLCPRRLACDEIAMAKGELAGAAVECALGAPPLHRVAGAR
jgi:amino-acid N-acetyltransferase